MVAWQSVPIGGLEISARPTGWVRKNLPLPYFKGAKPKFKLVVKRLPNPQQIHQFNWFIKFSNGDTTGNIVRIPQLVPSKEYEVDIGDKLLGFSGDTILGIGSGRRYHTLCSFEVVPKWVLISRVLAILATAFLAAMLTALLT